MNKSVGWILVILLSFALAGCSKPAEPAAESQTSPEQGTASSKVSSETSNGDQGGKIDYTNQALLESAIKDIFARAEDMDGIQYENRIAYQGVETVQKIWQAKGNMKISTAVGGTETITLITEKQIVTYDVATKQGVAFANDTKLQEGDMPTLSKEDVGNLIFIAEESLDGEPCMVLTETVSAGTETVKFWLSKNYGIVMKSEVVDASTNTKMTLTVKNLKTFKPEANFFEAPKDITITKM